MAACWTGEAFAAAEFLAGNTSFAATCYATDDVPLGIAHLCDVATCSGLSATCALLPPPPSDTARTGLKLLCASVSLSEVGMASRADARNARDSLGRLAGRCLACCEMVGRAYESDRGVRSGVRVRVECETGAHAWGLACVAGRGFGAIVGGGERVEWAEE